MKHFYILSIFPESFDSYLSASILGRAQKQKYIKVHTLDIRKYSKDRYHSVDDAPYGGGAGMVMRVEPIYKAILDIKKKLQKIKKADKRKTRVILFSAKGKPYSQQDAKRLQKYENIIFICGRYEGVDERIAKYVADEELSVGPYVLTGGELPAMIVIDSVSRLVPGVLGNKESIEEESYFKENYLEYPHYTRPPVFENKSSLISKTKNWKVPSVLLSGHHQKIKDWRKEQSEKKQKKFLANTCG